MCRRELPVIDRLATEYGDRVAFVAPAWKSEFAAADARAAELMPSGQIRWGLDEDEDIFAAYGIPYQPASVLVTGDDRIVEQWQGARSEEEMRAAIEALIAADA